MAFIVYVIVRDATYSHYLNEHAPLDIRAIHAATVVAIVGLTVAGLHWAELARREIKACMTIWVLDMLAALLMVAAGCCLAIHIGQSKALEALPSNGVTFTVHHPVPYHRLGLYSQAH
jgi:hypothetical protein